MRRVLLLVPLVLASCFRAEFLEGTACEDDRDCAPRFVCNPPDTSTGGESSGGGGYCGAPDFTPPPTSSETGTGDSTAMTGGTETGVPGTSSTSSASTGTDGTTGGTSGGTGTTG